MQGESNRTEAEKDEEEDESKRVTKKARSSLSDSAAGERSVRKLKVLSPKASLVSCPMKVQPCNKIHSLHSAPILTLRACLTYIVAAQVTFVLITKLNQPAGGSAGQLRYHLGGFARDVPTVM